SFISLRYHVSLAIPIPELKSQPMEDLQGLLGYLNFSTGRPDPRVQAQLFGAWEKVAEAPAPWLALRQRLDDGLTAFNAAGKAAFRDVAQARAVLECAFGQLPSAYRRHHADLLFHQSDADLFQPGFFVRAFEAVLGQ